MDLNAKIQELAKEKNALILAHNYQPEEIQAAAHITGDSLELSRVAADNDADIIVFCGVHFMAESASILSPDKKVLLPEPMAGCPMADMAEPEDLVEMKKKHPDAMVITYINSSAAIKALSDVICTSSNAVDIVKKVDAREIIFVPDRNLGQYAQRFTDKKIILWDGFCPTHDKFSPEELTKVKTKHPDGLVIVHPECRPDIIDMADEVFSTGKMVKFVQETEVKKIIVGTESDMIVKLRSVAPHIEYIPASPYFTCPDMKKITLDKIYNSLLNEEAEITVNNDIREAARKALDRMLELS